MSDFLHGLRALRRAPGSTLLALTVLALGVGATTALAAVAHALLVEPLPYAASGRPVQVTTSTPQEESSAFAPANYLDLVSRQRVFDRLAAHRNVVVDLTEAGAAPERMTGAEVTGAFFDVFDVAPVSGRLFQAARDLASGEPLVVLSEGLWQRRFGGADVTGRLVTLNGRSMRIAGVAPASFTWPADAALWLLAAGDIPSSPLDVPDLRTRRDLHYMGVVGRLRAGVGPEAAAADAARVADELAREFPATNGVRQFSISTLEEQVAGSVRAPLLLLLSAAGVLLLIAWANVAGLQLARGAARSSEMAVRRALGASRARIVRQLLTESLTMGLLGALGGTAIALAAVQGIRQAGAALPRVAEVSVSAPVLGAAALLTIVCSVIFGTAPALQAARTLAGVVREGKGAVGAGRGGRAALVVGEIGLALVLVVGAALLAQSALRLVSQDPGFDAADVMSVSLAVPQERYPSVESQRAFYRDVLSRMQAPSALGPAAVAFPLPGSGAGASGAVRIEGRSDPADPDQPIALFSSVSAGYFGVTGIPILRGRAFSPADTATAEPVVIVSDTFARRHFTDGDPLAGRLNLGGDGWFRIVGVAGDVRQQGLGVAPEPVVYLPYEQFTVPFASLVFRPADRGGDLAGLVQARVHAVDPQMPVGALGSLDALLWEQTAAARIRSAVLMLFAGTALLLAAVGLYSLISVIVVGRTREFGVRLALGARPGQLLALVARQGAGLGAAGVGVGLLACWMLSRLVERFLFGVTATDTRTYGAAALVLLLVALAATLAPALRAARVDPMRALRS